MHHLFRLLAAATFVPWLLFYPPETRAFTAEEINQASYAGGGLPAGKSALTARIQVLLDRAGASPGVIDGRTGENIRKAIQAFQTMRAHQVDGKLSEAVWKDLVKSPTAATVRYTVTERDIVKLSERLPEDYAEMAKLKWLGYTSAAEALAEKFHMDIDLLKALNPGSGFSAGSEIWVADTGENAKGKVARIVADKSRRQLSAFDNAGRLVVSYPVTIGSSETPSPSGTHKVRTAAVEPTYAYKPDENFVQGGNLEKLQLPPGPNGPVGLVWIDLSKPTYGIHGTAEPAEIDKTVSNGCVHMTNWDALELAKLVSTGVPVEFKD